MGKHRVRGGGGGEAVGVALEATSFTGAHVYWGLSADSSGGSAPHYEVFVALRGLRNLSEENRDKVNETGTGSDRMSPSLCMPPGAVDTAERWGGGARRRTFLRVGKGRGESHRHTCVYVKLLITRTLGPVVHASSTCHTAAYQPHSAVLFSA